MTKAVSSGAKLLIVIIIIATVGVCISCRAELLSGTATYSGTVSTTYNFFPSSIRVRHPDLSGTCTLTVDFDARTASISFAGETINMRLGVPPNVAMPLSLEGAKTVNDWRWVVSGTIFSKKDPDKADKAVGSWLRIYKPHGHSLGGMSGMWRAQKVPTP